MNQNNNHKFTEEERKFFKDIANHIQANPNEYKQAGEWLNEYCSESAYWFRQENKLKTLKEKHNSLPILTYRRRLGDLENKIKEKRTPALIIRFQEAKDSLLNTYGDEEFISKEVAAKVNIITWLLTDADAEKANLHITELEKWEWEPLDDISKLTRGYAGFLFAQNEDAWMKLVRIAWEKISTGKSKRKGRKWIRVVISAIIVLAALTTLILNLDKIKEKIWRKTKKQKPSPQTIQQTMKDSPGGTQVAGDLFINKTENPLQKPIVAVNVNVEVKIKSDWDFNGRVSNMPAYFGFVKGNTLLLKAFSIGYMASQTGNGEVVYKGNLNTDSKDPSMGNPASFLKDAEYIQIEFGQMPSDSLVLGGDVICIINNSIRIEFSIPPQKLVNNKIYIRNLSESLQVLNEPSN